MASLVGRLAETLAERFASTWLLLSETTNFLSRTSIFPQYESDLMDLRRQLSASRRSAEVERRVRKDLTTIRESVRLQGYDLSLGKLDLSLQGFRNDASMAEGFRRIVIFIGRGKLWKLAGPDNHLELHRALERLLGERDGDVLSKHYLWYRWNHEQLIISGSDTETKEDFEALKVWCGRPENRLLLLGSLRRMR
ncbi:MAG: hypothetical protein JNG85_07460 [Spirochaetaceae bacterium]|nr:hypothetical protein [Spirochaetaceae bacterium]